MKEYIEERAVAIANYIIDYNATVRQNDLTGQQILGILAYRYILQNKSGGN